MTNTTGARKAFRVLGTTNDVTSCDLCGRAELKGTVVLVGLDADGNPDGDPVYYGASCGAKAAGWTTKEVRTAARAADIAEREAADAAREDAYRANSAAEDLAFAAWALRALGVSPSARTDISLRGRVHEGLSAAGRTGIRAMDGWWDSPELAGHLDSDVYAVKVALYDAHYARSAR